MIVKLILSFETKERFIMKNIIVVILCIISFNANAETPRECTAKLIWKTIGVGAAYGAVVIGGSSAVAVAMAPAGAVTAPLAVISTNAAVGGMTGAGTALVVQGYIEGVTKDNAFGMYCTQKWINEQQVRLPF